MEFLVKNLISALGIGALCLVIAVQRDALTAAKERTALAEEKIGQRDTVITALKETAARNSKAAIKLQTAHDRIAATLTERESHIESLIHDNATIRRWADTPLPDAIVGLREHPAITGADDYRQRLSNAHPLPTISGSAQD